MSVPAAFVGAWERRSIALDGAEPAEDATVIWLQSESAFADLRVPHDPSVPPVCFAGHTSWNAPCMSWRHDLDLAPSVLEDCGEVTWRGDDLIETGVTVVDGRTVRYKEVWRRLPGSSGAVDAAVGATAARVRVGPHELVANDRRDAGGGFTAEYRRDGAVVLRIGAGR